ncbi:hypothetical protein [Gordonia malaquae]|uniref:hypothetical protein n=1 Tax=Gordonia malaquae TaxID=410332 RepID=UPI0030FEE3F0
MITFGETARARALRIGTAAMVCGLLVVGTTQSTGGVPSASDRASVVDLPEQVLDRSTTVDEESTAPTSPKKSPPTVTSPDGTVCAPGRSATLGVVFSAVFDSFLPQIPAEHRGAARAAKTKALSGLHQMTISDLAISMHPSDFGASDDAPINTYRDPISQWIVTQLMNVKDGDAGRPIRVDNLTVSQAVETAWLYFYLTAVIPLTMAKDTMPTFYSVGPTSLGTLITLPITIGTAGMKLFYKAISNAVVDRCTAQMTPAQIEQAGRPDPDLAFTSQVPSIIADIAGQVSIAEPGTCPAVADMSLGRVVERTSEYLQAVAPNRGTAAEVKNRIRGLKQFMKTTLVPHNLIPADPADFSTIETLLSYGLGVAPYAGGALTDMLVGLAHNLAKGDKPGEMVPMWDLTVTKSLTAAYFAYALTTQVISLIQDQAASGLAATMGGVDLMPRIKGVINAPNTYGLVVFHNVLRSICLDEDRTTVAGTGVSATRW